MVQTYEPWLSTHHDLSSFLEGTLPGNPEIFAVGVARNKKLRERAVKLALALTACIDQNVNLEWASEETSFLQLLALCKEPPLAF
jgi:hypothetical protein